MAIRLALLAAALLPLLAAPRPAAAQEQPVAFVDVTVVPMDREGVLERQTVVVRDGRIAEIGPSSRVRAPQGARVIDGRGKFLMPGLAEMHAHIPPPQAGEEAIRRTMFLYLAGGVTTARGMLGHPRHLELRAQTERGEVAGPRIFTSGPSLNGNSVKTPEDAARLVREQKAAGYDLLKLHPGLSRPLFDAIAEAAHREGIGFAGHVSADVGLRRALEARYASIDHLDGYLEALAGRAEGWNPQQSGFFGLGLSDQVDLSGLPALVSATREAGVWNVPTQSLMETLAGPGGPDRTAERPEVRYLPRQTVEQWIKATRDLQADPAHTPERAARFLEQRRAVIRALHEGGAGLLLGSDAPQVWNVPGFSTRRELQYLVDAGLTPYQALRTGTTAAAEYFGEAERWGTVAAGREADLLLLDADPLADVGNVWKQAGVMARGRWIPQAEIDRRLEEIAAEVR